MEDQPPTNRTLRTIESQAKAAAMRFMQEGEKQSYPARNWIVALGLPSLLLGWVLGGMTGLIPFALGRILVYVIFAWFIFDLWKVRDLDLPKRLTTVVIVVILCAFSWYVFRPMPLYVFARLVGSGYTDKQVAGIEWSPKYGDLRLSIINKGESDYSDLDITLDPSVDIMGISALRGCPDAQYIPLDYLSNEEHLVGGIRFPDAVKQETLGLTVNSLTGEFDSVTVGGSEKASGEHSVGPLLKSLECGIA